MKSLIILTFQANEDMAKDLEEAEEELERINSSSICAIIKKHKCEDDIYE